MNLDFNDEQSLLRDTVSRFVQEHYSLDKRNAILKSPAGFSADHWRTMGYREMGVRLGIPPATVGTRLLRARKRIKRLLTPAAETRA